MILIANYFMKILIFALIAVKGNYAEVSTEVQEVSGKVDEKDVQTIQISDEGDSLLIGSRPLETIGKPDSSVLCEKQTGIGDYKDDYGTKIWKRSRHGYKITEKETQTKVEAKNYFVYLKRDLWSCVESGQNGIKFLRVVNTLYGVTSFQGIKYFPGSIEVTRKYNLFDTNQQSEMRTAKVHEVKYLLRNDRGTFVVSYLGKVQELPSQNNDHGVPDLSQSFYMEIPDTSKNAYIRELKDKKKGEKVTLGSTGIQLAIEYIYPENNSPDADRNTQAVCYQENGIQPFPIQFRIQMRRVVKYYGKDHKAELDNLNEYYIPIDQQLWWCTAIRQDRTTYHFYRVVNEIIGRKSVGEVTIHEGVTDLFSIKLDEGSLTVRAREVRYLDANTLTDFKYLGTVGLFERPMDQPLKPAEVPYTLSADNRIFKLFIGSKGYDIQVGEKYEKEIFRKTVVTVCELHSDHKYLPSYQTKFRLKTRTTGNLMRYTYRLENLNKDKEQQFITYLKQEVSYCQLSTQPFLRVFNVMAVLVPVHMVEFFEGVFVYDEILDRHFKTVRIIEIKYLDPNTKKPLKFRGEIELKNTEHGTPSKLPDDVQAMKVTNDDIFWRVGHFYIIDINNVDFNSYKRLHEELSGILYLNEAGKYDMVLTITNNDKIGTISDTAVCMKTEKTFIEGLSFNEIQGEKKGVRLRNNQCPRYFQDEDRMIWTCQLPNNGLKFETHILNRRFKDFTSEFPSPHRDNIRQFHWGVNSRYSQVGFHMDGNKNYIFSTIVTYHPINQTGKADNVYKSYEGRIEFDPGMESNKVSGTETIGADQEQITKRLTYLTEEIGYKVEDDRRYEAVLHESAEISLLIGSKWQHVFEDASSMIQCKRDNDVKLGWFEAFYRTRIREIGSDNKREKRPPNQQIFHQHFDVGKQEVWNCESTTNRKLIRIMNHFYIKPGKCQEIKDLHYYDGVTVLLGRSPYESQATCTEIVEVKYMNEITHNILKVEGKILLTDDANVPISNEITARKLEEVAKLEVHYLPAQQVHKLSVSDRGVVLEIGVANEKTVKVSRLICVEDPQGYLPAYRDQFKPLIKMNKFVSQTEIEQEIMHVDDYRNWFNHEQTLMDCHEPGKESKRYTRVMNYLKPHEKYRKKIATIFHYDGVEIEKKTLAIREIKFYEDRESRQTIRIVGFVHQKEKKTKELNKQLKAIEHTTEIFYKLDTKRLFVKSINKEGKGAIIEIGSPIEETFGSREDTVLCRREKDHFHDDKYRMRISADLKGQSDDNSPLTFDAVETKKYFSIMKQELWHCEKDKKNKFIRIVNVYVALKDISRIYFPDGVTIGKQILPDNALGVTRVREIKYIQESADGKLVPLKYDGKITLENVLSNKATTLFQMPSEFKEYEFDSMDAATMSLNEVKYWPLHVLRHHAIIKTPSTTKTLPAINYPPGEQRQVKEIPDSRGIKLWIGSEPERILKTANQMKCLLDDWNPINERKFLTRIKLDYNSDYYELDADTILEYFDLKGIEVWICVDNDDTMLRVQTHLIGVVAIHSTLSYPGVTVTETKTNNNEKTVEIIEVKYIDANDFKTLKYEGELKIIEKPRSVGIEGSSSSSVVNVFNAPERKSWIPWVMSYLKPK